MNQRNVDALSKLIRAWAESPSRDEVLHYLDPEELAGALASRGVLMPASLTDAQAYDVPADKGSPGWTDERSDQEVGQEVREYLARIARGEA